MEIKTEVERSYNMIHDLKCWPEYFKAVKSGIKPFEYRKDDRGYAVGDILHLREYDPATFQYSGDEIDKTVTYVLPVVTYGAGNDERYVIMGLASRPDWTPCSEGLPTPDAEENGVRKRYLCTTSTPSGKFVVVELIYITVGEKPVWYDNDYYELFEGSGYQVMAWMPRPQPYNPDRKEDADHIVDANKKAKEDAK